MPIRKKTNLKVNAKDVFSYGIDKKTKLLALYLNGEVMPERHIKSLKEEIAFIEQSMWWRICNETLRQKAIEKAIYKSTTFDDMRNAKELLEVLNLIAEMNAVVKSWKPPEPGQPIPSNPIQH